MFASTKANLASVPHPVGSSGCGRENYTMFNREYQKRATRQGIKSFLAQEFYRPPRPAAPLGPSKLPDAQPRADHRCMKSAKAPAQASEQLTLRFDP